jgi:hypothetical protein
MVLESEELPKRIREAKRLVPTKQKIESIKNHQQ